jgi:hypothetical protein
MRGDDVALRDSLLSLLNGHTFAAKMAQSARVTLHFRTRKRLFTEWFTGKARGRSWIIAGSLPPLKLCTAAAATTAWALWASMANENYATKSITCGRTAGIATSARVNFITDQSSLPLAWHCRALASCYFHIVAGIPAAFSKRFVIDLFPGQGQSNRLSLSGFFRPVQGTWRV